MESPLRERLRWRNATDAEAEPPATRATLSRVAALLSGIGALICLVGAFVPGDAQYDDAVLMATAGAAALLAAVLLAADERLPVWAFHPVALTASVLSTTAAYGWGSESAYGPLLLLWATMFAFYVFERANSADA